MIRLLPLLLLGCLAPAATLEAAFEFTNRVPEVGLMWVDGPATAPRDLAVTQRDRTFLPGLVAGSLGSTVIIGNADEQTHNVFTVANGLDVDLGLAAPRQEVRQAITWAEGTFVPFGCKIHPQMRLWIGSVASPWQVQPTWERATKTGNASLTGLPIPAVVHIWCPHYAPVVVTIPEGTTVVDLFANESKRGTVRLTLRP